MALRQHQPGEAESIRFKMRHYIGYFDCRWNDETSWARVMTYEHLQRLGGPEIAMKNCHPDTILENTGWHFSYMGGDNSVISKLQAYSHQEFNKPPFTDPGYFRQCLLTGTGPLHADHCVKLLESLDELPETIKNNKDDYAHHFLSPR